MAAELQHPPRPAATVRWAAAIVAVQGAALTLVALAYGGWVAATTPKHTGLAAGVAVLGLLLGVVLLLTARGLAATVRASVSPIVLVELLLLPIGWSMGQAHQWALCAALVAPALAVLALLFVTQAGRDVARGEGR